MDLKRPWKISTIIESLRRRWFVQASLATIYNYIANGENLSLNGIFKHSLQDDKNIQFVALDVILVLISHMVLPHGYITTCNFESF